MSKKRYVTTVTFYSYGSTPQEALVASEEICQDLKDKYDNQASVEALYENQFGIINSNQINYAKL